MRRDVGVPVAAPPPPPPPPPLLLLNILEKNDVRAGFGDGVDFAAVLEDAAVGDDIPDPNRRIDLLEEVPSVEDPSEEPSPELIEPVSPLS